MRKILIFTVLCIITVSAWAVPARKGGIVVTQPDGSKITIHQHGDESFHWITNEKGEWLKQDADGFYQVIDSMSVKKAQSRRKANAIQPKQQIGKQNIAPRGLVILVNYQDVQFSTGKSEMEDMFMGENYSRDYSYSYVYEDGFTIEYNVKSRGSVQKYFYDASYGQYNPQFDVVGPVTVSKNMAYYGENDRYGDDKNAELMVAEACELVDDSVDFSVYDSDNDGEVDFVCVIYAGYGEANGGASNTIWPHHSYVSYKINLQLDGKKINDYVCCNEINYYSKQHEGIGTFCHEFSHTLGLPDLYPTNDANHKTLGDWDIMASGSYNNDGNTPPTYSAYERFYMGWLTPRILVDSENVVLHDLQETNTALLISETDEHNLVGNNPNPTTFYLIENRQQKGWDNYFPGHGMMLTKIQYNSTKWNNNTVNNNASAMGVDLIEADNINTDKYVNGKSGDLFPGGAVEYLGIENHPIKHIKQKDGIISFSYKNAIPNPDNEEPIDERCRIYYTTFHGESIFHFWTENSINLDAFGANFIGEEFIDGQWVLIFDKPITTIGDRAFRCPITSITLPNSVTSIGDSAFYYCTSLTSITIPDSVTSIGSSAFRHCSSLTSITIPNSVKSIGDNAFYYCRSLTSITIPNSVTSIGDSAFYNCTSLTSITIPDSVTSIGNSAFSRCSSLTSITIPNSVTSIGSNAFAYCNFDTVIIGYSVTNIENQAFYPNPSLSTVFWNAKQCADFTRSPFLFNDKISTFVFGDSVEHIPANLCGNIDSITTITIPNSVTSIGEEAFEYCELLNSVTIGNGVINIGNKAFSNCQSLTSITIPNSVTSIGEEAFSGCHSLTSITIPNSVTSIGEMAFYFCKLLNSVSIGNGVTSLGSSEFANCSIDTVTIGYSVKSIDYSVFTGNPLTTIYWNAIQCTDCTTRPFQSTKIKTFVFGDSVEYIPAYLCDQAKFETVTIPASVTSIGECAFTNNSYLCQINCEAETPPVLAGQVFGKRTTSIMLYVPCGTVSKYKNTEGWKKFNSIFEPQAIYSIEVLANSDFGTASVKQNTYCDGAKISATPARGYAFLQWSDGNIDNPRTLMLTQDTVLTAEFTAELFTISTQPSDPERGETTGDTTVQYSEYVTIAAIPYYGYHFSRWNDYTTENPRTVKVTSDETYTAYFEPNTYSITKQCNSEEGTIEGVSSAKYLDEVTLTANPAAGHAFAQWSDGVVDNPRTFVITQDTTFAAEFTINTYEVIINENEYGSTTGAGVYNYGDEVTLVATPHDGYSFIKWSNGVTDNPYIFIIMDNVTLSVEFDNISSVENTNTQSQQSDTHKLLRNGQLLILRDGKTYNAMGAEIK